MPRWPPDNGPAATKIPAERASLNERLLCVVRVILTVCGIFDSYPLRILAPVTIPRNHLSHLPKTT